MSNKPFLYWNNTTSKILNFNYFCFTLDGVFIFHNPFAKYPLQNEVFKNKRIRQVSYSIDTNEIFDYFEDKHLTQRLILICYEKTLYNSK